MQIRIEDDKVTIDGKEYREIKEAPEPEVKKPREWPQMPYDSFLGQETPIPSGAFQVTLEDYLGRPRAAWAVEVKPGERLITREKIAKSCEMKLPPWVGPIDRKIIVSMIVQELGFKDE